VGVGSESALRTSAAEMADIDLGPLVGGRDWVTCHGNDRISGSNKQLIN